MTGPRHAGFSLLELLVTLFVIVLVTSLVSLTVSTGGTDIELEAKVRNLGDVAAYALDEAQLTGRDYGLLLREEEVNGQTVYSYEWLERAAGGWRTPQSGKEVFASQSLPAGFELQLELEDSPFREKELALEEEELRPQVVFYASGETTVGSIDVRRRSDGELLWRIRWDLLGRFELLPRGEEPELE
jgi:prepilin-type N-terminal cleavage/methylation domain-containing protein